MTHTDTWPGKPATRLVFSISALILVGIIAVPLSFRSVELTRIEQVRSVTDLQRIYAGFDYSLASVRDGAPVPRLSISDVPDGWDRGLDPAARKIVFFESVLPLVLIVNEHIREDRKRLLTLDSQRRDGKTWHAVDRRWLTGLARRYGVAVSPDAIADSGAKREIATLLRRMAPIPPSLALAQAAVESAYGTSRFAIAGNALFGQWTTGAGLKPQEQRSAKARFQVAAFGSPLKSVEAYARNLNTHRAYRKFRAARQAQSLNGADPAGLKLISTLRV